MFQTYCGNVEIDISTSITDQLLCMPISQMFLFSTYFFPLFYAPSVLNLKTNKQKLSLDLTDLSVFQIFDVSKLELQDMVFFVLQLNKTLHLVFVTG